MIFKKKSDKPAKEGKSANYLGGMLLSKMAIGGAARLRSNADEVNKLNVFPVPDGDTGDNMRMTIESGIAAIEKLDTDDLAEVMRTLSHGMLLGARGNSGVILSQFFDGTAKGFSGVEKADPAALGRALQMGVKQAYTSVMTPTEGTILTVAREAVEYAVAQITPASTIRTFFADLVGEMHAAVERTPEMLTVLKDAGVVDSGGAGLFYIMDGFNRVLNGEEIEDSDASAPSEDAKGGAGAQTTKPAVDLDAFGPDSVMTYGYCTELLVRLQNSKSDPEQFDLDALKNFLGSIGNSVVAFRTESVVKLHVHTLTPQKVLDYMQAKGEFLTVKIENMSLQHSSLTDDSPDEQEETKSAPISSTFSAPAKAVANEPAEQPRKQYGIVAVCLGDGMEALYRDIGTDQIIRGGQTQNPSTNDFLQAFEAVNADHILVFPNNGNILMAAQQAASLYERSTVHVLPSKNVGTGYVAISSADLSDPDPESVIAQMNEAMAHVTAAYLSPAIRDTELNGFSIHAGDTIGIIGKEIVVCERQRLDAACALASRLLSTDDKFMLTVFTGKDALPEETEQLQASVSASHPDAELYLIEGDQEIYPYIFVAE